MSAPSRWADIWLNEGWATYASWIWTESRGGLTAQHALRHRYDPVGHLVDLEHRAGRSGCTRPVRHSGLRPRRGAPARAALKVGDAAFWELAQTWVERYGGGTATTADFIALSAEVSGQDLTAFFQVWAYDPTKPTSW